MTAPRLHEPTEAHYAAARRLVDRYGAQLRETLRAWLDQHPAHTTADAVVLLGTPLHIERLLGTALPPSIRTRDFAALAFHRESFTALFSSTVERIGGPLPTTWTPSAPGELHMQVLLPDERQPDCVLLISLRVGLVRATAPGGVA